jgi:regulatory protein
VSPRDERARKGKLATRAELEKAALAYLSRVECTAAKLRAYLTRRADPALAESIEELLARYQASSLVSDARFAENAVRRMSRRGTSERAIAFRLGRAGLSPSVVGEALAARASEIPEPELEAARTLVRRRRLGPLRPENERELHRRRDLAVLARAGFDFETARRALGSAARDDEEF